MSTSPSGAAARGTDPRLIDASERLLVAAVARWHAPALLELHARHAGAVYACAPALSADHRTADAVVVEVFRDLWLTADELQYDETSLRPWLLAQAYRRAGDRVVGTVGRQRVGSAPDAVSRAIGELR